MESHSAGIDIMNINELGWSTG